jgi:phosphopantothenoylcysteine synthetase/decarboxylase
MGLVGNLCTLVVCGAPLASRAVGMAAGLVAAGWRVEVITTPAAEQWVDLYALGEVVGAAPRSEQRPPDQAKRRERASAIVVAPITFNSINKLASGIADSLAHSAMCEALGERLPFVAVPMVNQYLAGHPVWEQNVRALTQARVTWVSMLDGTAGEIELVQSGTGDELVSKFEPEFVSGHLPTVD